MYHFYPRSPCGERPYIIRHAVNLHSISIHALLAESDSVHPDIRQPYVISIHALLAESDSVSQWTASWILSFLSTLSLRRATVNEDRYGQQYYFYPRSPCGERRVTVLGIQHKTGISIHALLAESDLDTRRYDVAHRISIHALLAESDISALWTVASLLLFLSTLSLRRATRIYY